MLAVGAEQIHEMRRSGHRPGSDVVVSLIGEMPVEWLVMADLDTEYDWLWAIDLNVWVVANTKMDKQQLSKLLWSFKAHRPKSLYLWLDDKDVGFEMYFYPTMESIKLPVDQWKWQMERQRLLKFQNDAMRLIFSGVQA